jgi:hypothetical protein
VRIRVSLTGPYYPIKNPAKNVKVDVLFSDLNNQLIYNTSYFLEELKVDDIDVKEFNFSSSQDINEFKVCATVFINDQKTNQKCIVQKKKEIPIIPSEKQKEQPIFIYLIIISFAVILFIAYLINKKTKKSKIFILCFLVFFMSFFSVSVTYAQEENCNYDINGTLWCDNGGGVLVECKYEGWEPELWCIDDGEWRECNYDPAGLLWCSVYSDCDKDYPTYEFKGKDITSVVLTNLTDDEGRIYLPLGTTIKGRGMCSTTLHWCKNTATSYTSAKHKFSILKEGEVVIYKVLVYNLTKLNKTNLVEVINSHTYENGFFWNKKPVPILESDIPSNYKTNYSTLEDTVINIIPKNVAARINDTNCTDCGANCSAGAKYVKLSDAWGYIIDKKCKKGNDENGKYYIDTNEYHFAFEKIFRDIVTEGYIDVYVKYEKKIIGCEEDCIIAEDVEEFTMTKPGIYKLYGSDATVTVDKDLDLNCDDTSCEVIRNTKENSLFDKIMNFFKKYLNFV